MEHGCHSQHATRNATCNATCNVQRTTHRNEALKDAQKVDARAHSRKRAYRDTSARMHSCARAQLKAVKAQMAALMAENEKLKGK